MTKREGLWDKKERKGLSTPTCPTNNIPEYIKIHFSCDVKRRFNRNHRTQDHVCCLLALPHLSKWPLLILSKQRVSGFYGSSSLRCWIKLFFFFIDENNFGLAGSEIIRTTEQQIPVCFGISTKGQRALNMFYYRRQMKCGQRSFVWCMGRLCRIDIWPKNSVLCLMGWVGAPVHSNKTQRFSFLTSKI